MMKYAFLSVMAVTLGATYCVGCIPSEASNPLEDAYANCPVEGEALKKYSFNAQSGFTLDGSYIYWSEKGNWGSGGYNGDGRILRAPIAGGDSVELAVKEDQPSYILVRGGYVYWSTATKIRKMPVAGGPVVDFVDEAISKDMIANETDLFFTSGKMVKKIPLAGGTPTVLVSNEKDQSNLYALALDDNSVYYSTAGADSQVDDSFIMKVPLGGGSPSVVASGQTRPTDLAVDATHVYWVNEGNPENLVNISRAPVNGGTAQILVSGVATPFANQDQFKHLNVDAYYVYFSNGGTAANGNEDGSVMRVPLAGGTATALESNLQFVGATSMVLDGCSLYYVANAALYRRTLE